VTDGAVTVRCPSCSRTWEVLPRTDGTFPQTARCATGRGGCGRVSVKVPRPSAVRSATGRRDGPAAAGGWNPPSGGRPAAYAELCPVDGHGPLIASPRGTLRVCTNGCGRVAPPGALTPYSRGGAAVRQIRSQRENDLAALDLAGRKGVMLGELRELTASGKLDDAGVMKAEWFAEQVKAAASLARLDDLIALFREAGPRPRRWWQQRPALTGDTYAPEDDDGEDKYPGESGDGQGDTPAPLRAVPASVTAADQGGGQPHRMTWAEAITACGWRLSRTIGGCQIVDERSQLCGQDTAHHIGDGWICAPHHAALGDVITADYRRQQQRSA
jgi:hypothetical protein